MASLEPIDPNAILLERLDIPRTPAEIAAQIAAYVRLTARINLIAPLPPMGGWRILPDFAALLVATIQAHTPRVIVELGGGISTLLCAYALRAQGSGQVYSYDHDADYLAGTRALVAAHGLSDHVTLTHAPLTELVIDDARWLWYDSAAFASLDAIDLLVIDGPPQHDNPTAQVRYPAVPLLFERLRAGALILLDDAARADEQIILTRWRAGFGLIDQSTPPTEKGAALLLKA